MSPLPPSRNCISHPVMNLPLSTCSARAVSPRRTARNAQAATAASRGMGLAGLIIAWTCALHLADRRHFGMPCRRLRACSARHPLRRNLLAHRTRRQHTSDAGAARDSSCCAGSNCAFERAHEPRCDRGAGHAGLQARAAPGGGHRQPVQRQEQRAGGPGRPRLPAARPRHLHPPAPGPADGVARTSERRALLDAAAL